LAGVGTCGTEVPDHVIAVRSVTLKPARGSAILAEVELVNNGSETITAYTTTVTLQYPDGRAVSQSVTTDVVYLLGMDRIGFAHPTEVRFDPGVVTVEHVALSANRETGPAATATAKVEMVAMEDGSALGAPEYIRNLQTERSRDADVMDDVVLVLGDLLQAPEPRSELKNAIARRMASERRSSQLQAILAPVVADGAHIDVALKLYKARRDICREHAILKVRRVDNPEGKEGDIQ
jgi:hypothetical protein